MTGKQNIERWAPIELCVRRSFFVVCTVLGVEIKFDRTNKGVSFSRNCGAASVEK